eukprot:gene1298-1640_t
MKLLFVVLLLSILTVVNSLNTPLEKFVYKHDDGVGQYYIHKTIREQKYTAYVLNFTSLNWLTPEQSSNPKWWHWLTICVPNIVLSDYGFLFVTGGEYSTPMDHITTMQEKICVSSNSIVSQLFQNPNQPLVFNGDGVPRVEDGILAYTWNQFIKNQSNPDWLGQFALTKAVVRAMDTVQDFVRSKYLFYRVNKFVVSGGSKRGWASWLTAAVDSRVKAVIPIVFPTLNLIQNSINHYRSYGGWSFAYGDYFTQGLMKYLNAPEFEAIARQVDPIYYINQLRMPKYIINAVGDEYFLPDSANFFWSQLMGTSSLLRIHPNAGHSLITRDKELIEEIISYYNIIINKQKLPEFDWSIVPDPTTNQTTIYVNTKNSCSFQKPSSVVVYQADTLSTTRRDWRFHTFNQTTGTVQVQNITWVPTPLKEVDDDFYSFTVSTPPQGGWRGAFIELTYPSFFGPQRYTTDFFYAPFNFPFENCGNRCQQQPFPL